MAKIICPNAEFTGVSASIEFVNGVGETENEHLIEWFKDRGYKVEEQSTDEAEDSVGEDEAIEAVEKVAKEDKKGAKHAKK